MNIKKILALTALVGLGLSTQATVLNYSFLENGTGILGATSTFTEGGVSILATGENDTLYGKNDGPGETGLGVTSDPQHEVNIGKWVQLDIHNLVGDTLAKIFFGSVQQGETAKLYFSDTANTLGTLITTITSNGGFDITSYLSHQYIDVIAGNGNIVIAALTATTSVPDGGTTVAMLGVALTGIGLIRRKLSA